MKKIIVNADGYGFTFGNNKAILEVMEQGFIRSVSVNVTWPAVKEVSLIAQNFPHVSIGIHLNLSVGPSVLPASEIPSLVGANGEFHGSDFPRRARKRLLNHDEMKKELRAQINRLRELGVSITHWDSHQGRHLYPGFFEAAMEVCREEKILATRTHDYYLVFPQGRRCLKTAGYYLHHAKQIATHAMAGRRMKKLRKAGFIMPDRRLVLQTMGNQAVYKLDCWKILLHTLPDGINFIECHPGHPDAELAKYSHLTDSREKEWELFRSPELSRLAAELGIESANYHELDAANAGAKQVH